MKIRKTVGIALLALSLAPAYVAAQDMEMKATVVTKGEKEIKVKTKDDEKSILVGSKTKGLENAKEGSNEKGARSKDPAPFFVCARQGALTRE